VNVERVRLPKALEAPEALKYVRNIILDILREYKIEAAGIRITESNSQHLDMRRIQIEGVIQEAFASSIIATYYVGQISNISAKVGIARADFKRYVEGEVDLELVENWDQFGGEEREAILAAMGATNA
jgi:hypothetical protein